MEIKASTLRIISKSGLANRALNGFGYVARALNGNYVIGGSRSLAEICKNLTSNCELEIKADGIFIDNSRKLSANYYLIEAFLKHGIEKVQVYDAVSLKALAALSRGETTETPQMKATINQEYTEQLLPGIEKQNNIKTMKMNALTALAGGIAYGAIKAFEFASSYSSLVSLDVMFSTFLVGTSLISCGINVLKQTFVVKSTNYKDPEVSIFEKTLVKSDKGPKVTILIPAYNEPVEVLRETLRAATSQDYANYEVVLLLDSKVNSDNFFDALKMVEEEFGEYGRVKVFTRKLFSNITNTKLNKADNINAFLNYGLGKSVNIEYEPQTGFTTKETSKETADFSYLDPDYIVITDADYMLAPSFLVETVPLLHRDKNAAYVMTPQNLKADEKNPVETSNATLMNSSWQVLNKGVAENSRVLFGGCNALISKTALESVKQENKDGSVSWLPSDTLTEDLSLTLKFIKKKYSSYYISKPLAVGLPISSLGDHLNVFWRYTEGSIENTLYQTIPALKDKTISLFSLEGMEYLSKAINPIIGGSLGLVAMGPLFAYLGINFPVSHPIEPLIYYLLLSNAAKSTLKASGTKSGYEHAKIVSLMYMHFPVFIHASYTAIKNYALGQNETAFKTSVKDGSRSRIPLMYMLPMLGLMGTSLYAMIGHANEFLNTFEFWRLECSLWASLPVVAIGYGLSYFNGIKNTFSDVFEGFKRLLFKEKRA